MAAERLTPPPDRPKSRPGVEPQPGQTGSRRGNSQRMAEAVPLRGAGRVPDGIPGSPSISPATRRRSRRRGRGGPWPT
jgi:hypothetical protein